MVRKLTERIQRSASARLSVVTVSSQAVRWLLLACVALALLLRLGWQVRAGFYAQPETWEYDDVARSLVSGHGYVYRFLESDWRTYATSPLYPFVLALLHVAGGGPDAYWLVGLFQAALSAALVLPTFAAARRLHGEIAGVAAAAIVAVHPGLIVYAAKVHEFTLDAFLLALFMAMLLRAARVRAPRAGVMLGAAGGAAAFARPTLASFALLAVAALAIRRPWRPALIAGAMIIAAAVPWTVRTLLVLGPGAPLSPLSCATLWMGNNPNASGSTLGLDGRSVFLSMPAEMRGRVIGKPEQEQGRVFCEETGRYLAADPVRSVGWWVVKLGYFWWFSPNAGVFYPPGWLDAYRVAYAAEAALVMVGAFVLWRSGWRAGLLFVLLELFAVSVAQSLAYVEGRHRLVLEPSLASLAGAGLASVLRRVAPRLAVARRREDPGMGRATE